MIISGAIFPTSAAIYLHIFPNPGSGHSLFKKNLQLQHFHIHKKCYPNLEVIRIEA